MARRNFSYEEVPTGQEATTPQPLSQHSNGSRQSYHDSPPGTPIPPAHSQYNTPLSTPLEAHVSPSHRYHPSAHPDSKFRQANRARASSPDRNHHRRSSSSRSVPLLDQQQDPVPPPPPPHRRKPVGSGASPRHSGQDQGFPVLATQRGSFTPYTDDSRTRQAMDGRVPRPKSMIDGERRSQPSPARDPSSQRRSYFGPETVPPGTAGGSPQLRQKSSYSSSNFPFVNGAATPGSITPNLLPSEGSSRSYRLSDYQSPQLLSGPYMAHDSPYGNNSFATQVSHADINPQDILDDGDDGFMPVPKRKSIRNMAGFSGRDPNASRTSIIGAPAGSMGTVGGMAGKQKDSTTSVVYDPVGQRDGQNGGAFAPGAEKSEWLAEEKTRRKKMRLTFGIIGGIVLALIIAGAVLGGVFGSRAAANKESGRGGADGPGESVNNADDDLATNGDINKNTPEIKALMNNGDLHKVFPAMDYTPWGTQYPLCEEFPPSQNNVTRDMAVLSQLTNVVRLYGTDCNKTEMVLHSIKQLGLTDMKVWIGVWIDTNTTTNERQLEKMYRTLEQTSDHSIFKGVIVGNEALYRAGTDKYSSEQTLIKMLGDVKSNFTKLGYDLPVTTSDLGDNWTASLVQAVDVIMSNIHPFFAGVPAEEAAGWTYSFWTNKNDPLVLGTDIPQVISEIGWPSGGGNACGTTPACPDDTSGSVAGVKEMNTLMDTFICQALDNGTDFFWFEAFDEPWKVEYNEPGKEWEDKWGLMDPGRNLKKGLKIPDCGGRTV